MLTHRQP